MLTKAIIETNAMQMFSSQSSSKSSKSDASSELDVDAKWLEAQLVADREDVKMEDLSGKEELDDFDVDQIN